MWEISTYYDTTRSDESRVLISAHSTQKSCEILLEFILLKSATIVCLDNSKERLENSIEIMKVN